MSDDDLTLMRVSINNQEEDVFLTESGLAVDCTGHVLDPGETCLHMDVAEWLRDGANCEFTEWDSVTRSSMSYRDLDC